MMGERGEGPAAHQKVMPELTGEPVSSEASTYQP